MNMTFEQRTMWERLKGTPGNYYSQAAEPERDQFRSMIKDALYNGTVVVEFVKADGSTRVMTCTLSEAHGAKFTDTPDKELKEGKPGTKVNNEVQKVWDQDAASWRSFRWDRLNRVEFSIG